MADYINTIFGQFRSYDFFINLGSIIGSVILIILYFRKSKSWKTAISVYVFSLVIVELGFFTGGFVRGLSYGDADSLMDVLKLFVENRGSHFIGRVILVLWAFPLLFCLIFRKIKTEWRDYIDILCVFLAFQHIFNRVACLFNGCCCGKYYDGIFSFRYNVEGGFGPGYAYPVYPTQLFEIICMIILFATLLIMHIRRKRLLFVFTMGFSITIFISEFMMSTSGVVYIAGLSVIQYAAIVLLITGIVMSVWKKG